MMVIIHDAKNKFYKRYDKGLGKVGNLYVRI